MVESANKVVVQARLKGAGMHWHPSHINPMLALCSAICSLRWQEAWQEVLHHEQVKQLADRRAQATTRCQAMLASTLLLLLRFRPPTPPPAPPVPAPVARVTPPPATLPGSSCPS